MTCLAAPEATTSPSQAIAFLRCEAREGGSGKRGVDVHGVGISTRGRRSLEGVRNTSGFPSPLSSLKKASINPNCFRDHVLHVRWVGTLSDDEFDVVLQSIIELVDLGLDAPFRNEG